MSDNKIVEPNIFTSNKLFLQQVLSFKYFFIIITFLSLSTAYLYNRIAKTEYEVYATISATKDETSSMLRSNYQFSSMQPIATYNDIEDGISRLRSYSMIYTTINKLNLEIGYFVEKSALLRARTELYDNKPFNVIIHRSHIQPVNTKFYIDFLSDSTFRISSFQDNVTLFNYIDDKVIAEEFTVELDKNYKFNEEIKLDYLNLTIEKNPEFQADRVDTKSRYYFELYNPELMTKQYLRNLAVRRASPASTILVVIFHGESLAKSIYFLNNYLNFFFEESLTHKNATAINTINFIDSQISGISDSLSRSESEITRFRAANQVTNLTYQGQATYDKLQRIEKERDDMQPLARYYTYIINYLNTTEDVAGLVAPTGIAAENSLVNNLIMELLNLNSEKSDIITLRGERNPFLEEVENKIRSKRQYIIEIATNNLKTLQRRLSDLDYEINKLSREISALPRRELNMSNIQRKYDIDEANYTYFLQKRSEAYITMASNYPDFELLEPARLVTSAQIRPKSTFNYLVALIFGILIPMATMIIKNIFNFKITNPEYIQQIINRSPVATIYTVTEKSPNFLIENPNSISTEYFRALRSIIFRKLASKKTKTILLTSAQPGDGKSFISYNLALSIALVGKKTLIIDGDLKRPTLHKKFKVENKTGVTDFIIEKLGLKDIIQETVIPNLSFISAGPYLPNATEVIESGGLDNLFASVKSLYEYIIIDTSPIGLMTDAFLITSYADHILIVVRQDATFKDSLTNVLATLNSNEISNFDIVFNDMNIEESSRHYSKYYTKGKMGYQL